MVKFKDGDIIQWLSDYVGQLGIVGRNGESYRVIKMGKNTSPGHLGQVYHLTHTTYKLKNLGQSKIGKILYT